LRVGDDGDAKAETINIPTEARQKMLDNTEKLIYKFGMGVNPDDVDGNITNVRIKALYSNLDLKANDFEIEIEDFMDQWFYFLNRYFELTSKTIFDANDLYIVFSRSMIINEVEMLNANSQQQGNISARTRMENHPWVDNVEEEIKRIEEEQDDIELDPDMGSGAESDGAGEK